MGTAWKIQVWDNISDTIFNTLMDSIKTRSSIFDNTYSRFKKDSFIARISNHVGKVEVQSDFMNMFLLYRNFYLLSGGKINPLIGFTISDLGYDGEYSLIPQKDIRKTPDLFEAVELIDEKTIDIKIPVLFDFGALGKGYFVDCIGSMLREAGLSRYLVDGSGDILYEGAGTGIVVGLEDPTDSKKILGKYTIKEGSLCSSGTNRRRWRNYTHMIDPHTNSSAEEFITASWVYSKKTVTADALATSLFFVSPEKFETEYDFQYCLINKDKNIKKSAGFEADFLLNNF